MHTWQLHPSSPTKPSPSLQPLPFFPAFPKPVSLAASITVKGFFDCISVSEEVFVAKMSGAQGANPPGSFTDTTDASVPDADTQATKNKVDSTQDDKGLPVKLAADDAPNPNESAGLGGPTFGPNEGADKGVLGSSFTQ